MTKVICDICGKEIDKRALHMHMRTHERGMRNQTPQNQMQKAGASNPPEIAGEGAVEKMRGVGKKGLDILNAWDEAYHKLLPDLWCVINNNGDAYITPVLALHINSDGDGLQFATEKEK